MFFSSFTLSLFALFLTSYARDVYNVPSTFSTSNYNEDSQLITLKVDCSDLSTNEFLLSYNYDTNQYLDIFKIVSTNNPTNTYRNITIYCLNEINLDVYVNIDTSEVTGSPYSYTKQYTCYRTGQVISTICDLDDFYCDIYFYMRPLTQDVWSLLHNEDGSYDDGYIDGYDYGYDDGYDNGYDFGKHDGYDDGYADGESVGRETGYQEGLVDGYNNADMSFIFSGIVQVGMLPVNVFLAIFNWEIFGINLGAFVQGLLSVALVVIIFKFILGNTK